MKYFFSFLPVFCSVIKARTKVYVDICCDHIPLFQHMSQSSQSLWDVGAYMVASVYWTTPVHFSVNVKKATQVNSVKTTWQEATFLKNLGHQQLLLCPLSS